MSTYTINGLVCPIKFSRLFLNTCHNTLSNYIPLSESPLCRYITKRWVMTPSLRLVPFSIPHCTRPRPCDSFHSQSLIASVAFFATRSILNPPLQQSRPGDSFYSQSLIAVDQQSPWTRFANDHFNLCQTVPYCPQYIHSRRGYCEAGTLSKLRYY